MRPSSADETSPARYEHGCGLPRHQDLHELRGPARVTDGRDEHEFTAATLSRLREIAHHTDARHATFTHLLGVRQPQMR